MLVRAGEEDVAIVLDNLIENALVYAPRRNARARHLERRTARLAVLDEGPGMQPGDERRGLRPLPARPHRAPGTGLGLAIVETLARRWGGFATIRNRESGGACAEVGSRSSSGPPSGEQVAT